MEQALRQAFLLGVEDGLEKLAISPKDLAHVAKLAKSQLAAPAWLRRKLKPLVGVAGGSPEQGKRVTEKFIVGRLGLSRQEVKEAKKVAFAALPKEVHLLQELARRTGRPSLAVNPTALLRGRGMPGVLQKSLNHMFWAHERDEAKFLAGKASKVLPMRGGHNHPEVLLREHNRLVTFPEPKVSEGFKHMRNFIGEYLPKINYTWKGQKKMWEYGVTPRVSRHERRHIARIFGSKEIGQQREGIAQQRAALARAKSGANT